MNKESSKKILKYLKQGLSVRSCAKMSGSSISLVMKVRGLLVESETLKSTKVIEVPVVTKPKQTKDEVKLKEYLKEDEPYSETEEERAEWERMIKEENKRN